MGIIERASPFRFIGPHSDYEVWEHNNISAYERCKLVKNIIEQYLECEGLNILNLGPDNGGIPQVFSPANKITSFDNSYLRLKKHTAINNNGQIEGDFLFLPFKKKSFDLIIIQNVIEQISNVEKFLEGLDGIVKDNSIIYLCTPNKLSILNILSDPYSGLPFAALSVRGRTGKNINKYFFRFFSLRRLKKYFRNREFRLNTIQSLQFMFNNKHINDLSSHPAWIKFLKMTGFYTIVLKLANNKAGFINSYLTPTFYLVLRKYS
jgi:ubiquinone/menaquinone biosynthesis C-methylase UbiE